VGFPVGDSCAQVCAGKNPRSDKNNKFKVQVILNNKFLNGLKNFVFIIN